MKVKKAAIVYHKSDLDGVVSAAIATMYENSKNKDVIYIPYSYEDDVKKVIDKVDECGVVYVLDVSFGADSKTIFKKWLDEGKSLMWIDHHKGIIEDSKTWGFVVPGLRRVGTGACALASDLLMGKVPAIVRCLSDYDVWNEVKVVAMNTTEFSSKVFDSLTPDWLDGRKIKALMPFCIMPGGKVRFSLYECVEDSADCCEVSKRFGGGGHAGAAGFVLDVTDIRFREFIEKHKLISQ